MREEAVLPATTSADQYLTMETLDHLRASEVAGICHSRVSLSPRMTISAAGERERLLSFVEEREEETRSCGAGQAGGDEKTVVFYKATVYTVYGILAVNSSMIVYN
jgi:hypothetical protein